MEKVAFNFDQFISFIRLYFLVITNKKKQKHFGYS